MWYRRLEAELDGHQSVDWIDTREEIAQILDFSAKNNLTPTEIEDAIFAALFWRSVKFPPNARFGSLTENLDGTRSGKSV